LNTEKAYGHLENLFEKKVENKNRRQSGFKRRLNYRKASYRSVRNSFIALFEKYKEKI
jgi:hypothetical protein